MSILPESVIQQTMIRGFRAFRENEDLIRVLFRNLESVDLEDVVNFFKESTIDICINYPDKDLVIPAIVVLMGNETESDPVLGDLQQSPRHFKDTGAVPFPKEELLGDQTVLGAGSMSRASGPSGSGEILMNPTTAVGGTSTTITAPSSATLMIDPYEESDITAVIMEGTSAGDRRTVVGITPSLSGGPVVIEVGSAWTSTPDGTSVFMLVGPPDDDTYTGEPAKLFDSSSVIEGVGQIYEARYRLDILAYPQDLTIYMYSMLKAIFTVARSRLEKHGLLNFAMGGTDLGPMPEYYPQQAYRRSMNVSFRYSFSVLKEIEQAVATQLDLYLTVHDPDVHDPEDVERSTLTTTFSTS